MRKLDQKKQKSLWLMLRTWTFYERAAHKRHTTSGKLMRKVLEEWAEANK